jgi:hypothetical protein
MLLISGNVAFSKITHALPISRPFKYETLLSRNGGQQLKLGARRADRLSFCESLNPLLHPCGNRISHGPDRVK